MPQRFIPIVGEIAALLAASFSAIVAAATALMPNTTVTTSTQDITVVQQIVIMDDDRMRLVCVIGALGGAVLSTLVMAGANPTYKTIAGKILASSGAGILFTPMLFQWMGWVPNTDRLLAGSAAMALVSVGVIKTVVPLWQNYIAKKLTPPNP